MKFTKKSDYGLRLVTYLASKVSEGPISTRRIAEAEKILRMAVVESLKTLHENEWQSNG